MTDLHKIEQRRLIQQQLLDARHDARRRNRWGQYATPPPLALAMARYARGLLARRRAPLRFLEPALGSGAFYCAALRVFGFDGIRRAVGVELESGIAAAARDLWSSTSLEVLEDDFTKLAAPAEADRFDLILANPPYVRHHHLAAQEKHRLRRRVARQTEIDLSGLAGLYCYFLLLADAWLAPGALAMWLVPAELLDVNYGSAVRRYLSGRVTLRHVHRFAAADGQFDDALVSSAVVVFEKRRPPASHRAIFSTGGTLQKPEQSRQVSTRRLQEARKWGRLALEGSVGRQSVDGAVTLGELFDVKRGLATGNNAFFILPRDRARRLGITDRWLKPILPSPRYVSQEIIEADEHGYPRLQRCLVLIDCDRPTEEIRRRYPDFWDYLRSGIRRNAHRGYLASRRSPWYSQERRPAAPFLCTYMGRGGAHRSPFRMLWNQSNATAANVYLMLYPKNEMAAALQAEPKRQADVFAALSNIESDDFLSQGRLYGGGLHKVEPAELSRLPSRAIAEAAGVR